jgi:hypothetical protein
VPGPGDKGALSIWPSACDLRRGIDVWVDEQHRVRREELSSTECLAKTRSVADVHTTIEFSDFGSQRTASLPAADETADLTGYLSKALALQKPACG